MKRSRKLLSILLTLSLLAAMLVPMAVPAAAASDDSAAQNVPSVTSGDNKVLGTLQLKESETTVGALANNAQITINLPDGVEFSTAPTAGTIANYINTTVGGAGGLTSTATPLFGTDPAIAGNRITAVAFVSGSVKHLTVQVTTGGTGTYAWLVFYFGAVAGGTVDITSGTSGDILAEVENTSGGFVNAKHIIGTTASGGGTVSALSTPDVQADSTTALGQIKIKETGAGALTTTDGNIKIKLPKDCDWNVPGTAIASLPTGMVVGALTGNGTRTLEFPITTASTTAGSIIITTNVDIGADVEAGDLKVTVSGNKLTTTEITIGEVGDLTLDAEVEGDVPTVIAGQADQDIADFTIKEGAAGSLVAGRTINAELPNNVDWNTVPGGDGLTVTDTTAGDEKVRFTIAAATAARTDFEQENMTIDVPENFVGDVEIELSGTAGLEKKIVVAKAIAPVKAESTPVDLKLGTLSQAAGDIIITENAAGALMDAAGNETLQLSCPNGISFAKLPTIEVTSGDLELDADTLDFVAGTDKADVCIDVDNSSDVASTIKVSGIVYNIDRTVPEGPISLNIGGDGLDAVGAVSDEVVSVNNANLITSINLGDKASASFVIGSATYNANGVEKTMDVAPYVKDGRTFLPVRYVADALGVTEDNIIWDANAQTVTLLKGDKVAQMKIGSKALLVNGVTINMDVAAELNSGRTMLPFRFIAQALGATVGWDEATQTVSMDL